jgi:hypothetical protein
MIHFKKAANLVYHILSESLYKCVIGTVCPAVTLQTATYSSKEASFLEEQIHGSQ